MFSSDWAWDWLELKYQITAALVWTKQRALKGKGQHTQQFAWQWEEWAALHSNGCQAQGKLHLHVSWQRAVPVWEKQQQHRKSDRPAEVHRVALTWVLKEDSSMFYFMSLRVCLDPQLISLKWSRNQIKAVTKRKNQGVKLHFFQQIDGALTSGCLDATFSMFPTLIWQCTTQLSYHFDTYWAFTASPVTDTDSVERDHAGMFL